MAIKISFYNNKLEPVTHIDLESFIFSGGEVQVKLPQALYSTYRIIITAHLTSSDEIMKLLMTVDALRRQYGKDVNINLFCPYLPYARQDRVMNTGESLSVKVMCDLINILNLNDVTIWDAHSDVSPALLDNVRNVDVSSFVSRIPVSLRDCVLVSPDAGANKKVFKVASAFRLQMVRADKTRSVKDGSITGTVVYSEHVGDKNFLIIDDICDGGRTFIELAKVLRPLTNGKIFLYVTHGIFSKGLSVFEGIVDHIYTANVFPNVALDSSLTVLNLSYDPTHN